MDKAAQETIQDWNAPGNVTIEILATDHPEQATFTAFARKWKTLSPSIRWEQSDTDATLPGFALKENIIYSALPMERELAPFLKGIENLNDPALPQGVKQMLDKVDLPSELTLYIALQCPHCPVMVDMLIPLAAYCENIRLHIIDGSLFPEKAQADKVMAAPCLILDNDFRWTGSVPSHEVINMILNRDPAQLGTDTLKTILEEGRADWITEQMVKSGTLFKGFAGLLLHETWSVRLGAMVVAEAMAEKSPNLCAALAPVLMQEFGRHDIPVQGDILYALGEIGNLETRAWIVERMDRLDHDDLKDAAQDAVDAIESRIAP